MMKKIIKIAAAFVSFSVAQAVNFQNSAKVNQYSAYLTLSIQQAIQKTGLGIHAKPPVFISGNLSFPVTDSAKKKVKRVRRKSAKPAELFEKDDVEAAHVLRALSSDSAGPVIVLEE